MCRKPTLIFLFLFLAGLSSVLVMWYLFLRPKGVAVDPTLFPVRGIDVSVHTGDISWQSVKEQGYVFAYIKATEGENYVDPRFRQNLKSAREAGLRVGAYHFFRFNKDGKVQARLFLSEYAYQSGDLPPVIDIEEWGQLGQSPNSSTIRRSISDFIHTVYTATGQRPMVYTNLSTYNKYIHGQYPGHAIWICAFTERAPRLKDGRPWLFWQHAHNGKLPGVEGWVDLNVFQGDESAWRRFDGD